MRVLVVNTGSATAELTVLDVPEARECADATPGDAAPDPTVVADLYLDPWDGGADALAGAVSELIGRVDAGVDAVGHRVVHGGDRFDGPTRIDQEVRDAIEALEPLAPLHQARAVAGIAATEAALAGVPAVACFDTAFHADLPDAAATYAVPKAWRERWGLRRRGFHGISHAWAARRAAAVAGLDHGTARIVTCHLGGGASLCAVHGGRSVDTTMGVTPLEGLVMATRSGSVDPGLVLWLLTDGGLDVAEVADGLQRGGGLAGLAGPSTGGDLRAILPAAGLTVDGRGPAPDPDDDPRGQTPAPDPDAVLAIEVYLHRLRAGIAAMAAALGGIDALAFTGGAGQHQPAVRAGAVSGLGFLGLALDPAANDRADGDADVTAPSAPAHTVVVATGEAQEIARSVRDTLR